MKKTVVIPFLVFVITLVAGGVLIYMVTRLSQEEPVAPTQPDQSAASMTCTLDVKVQNEKHLKCINNTCTQVDGAGQNECTTIGATVGQCFACQDLVSNPASGKPALKVNFTPTAKSQNALKYVYNFGDGSAVVEKDNADPVEHTYSNVGNYVARLTVKSTDSRGNQISETNDACTTPINVTEVAKRLKCNSNYVCEQVDCANVNDCKNDSGCAEVNKSCLPDPVCKSLVSDITSGKLNDDGELEVTFVGDGDGVEKSYKFDFGDGQFQTTTNNTVKHKYTKDGEFKAKLTIVSKGKESSSKDGCMVDIEVNEPEDPVCLKLLASPKSGNAPLEVELSGAGDAEGTITYKFNFGDGEEKTTTTSKVTHTYKVGSYTAKLTILANGKESVATNECKVSINSQKVDTPTHLVCSNEACVSVSGTGDNECTTNADCQEADDPTHLVCRNQACVRVSGTGNNECTVNTDCLVPSAPSTAKPVVPKTGSNDVLIYTAAGIGLVITGIVIFGRRIL